MFARITHYKMKAGSRDAATAQLHQMKGEIMALPGLKQFINTMNEDGSGYVVSLVESKEVSDANADRVKALWGQLGEYLEAMPSPEGYDVIVDWSN